MPSELPCLELGKRATFVVSKARGFGRGGSLVGALSALKRSDVQLIYPQTCLKDSWVQDPVKRSYLLWPLGRN